MLIWQFVLKPVRTKQNFVKKSLKVDIYSLLRLKTDTATRKLITLFNCNL